MNRSSIRIYIVLRAALHTNSFCTDSQRKDAALPLTINYLTKSH